jgi:tripeptide aminopeptidase
MNDFCSRIVELAIAIQQIPAPTFHEAERAEFMRARFADLGLCEVSIDSLGNVYGRLAGTASENSLVVSAHLDTVFPLSVDLHYQHQKATRDGAGVEERILAPGIGDNSLGLAGLVGLVWALGERNLTLPGDLWLVANVGEEGLGNLRGMRAVVERFGRDPKAYIVLEGMALGQIYHRGLGALRTRISIQTAGGHSWIDHGQPSAIHELTEIATRLTALHLSKSPRTTLNIGTISGGSSVNTIAAQALLELDLRSESDEALETLAGEVEKIVRAARKPGVKVETEIIGKRPSGGIPAEHALVSLARECLSEVGLEARLKNGSTDANLPLSRGLPSVTIGLTSGGRAHSLDEFINLAPLERGMEQLTRLVSRVWDCL